MKTTFSFTGKAILEQWAKTPMKTLEEYVGKLILNADVGSDFEHIPSLDVGFIKILYHEMLRYDNVLLHKLSEDTYAIIQQEIHYATGELNIREIVLKFTEEMLPLFKDSLNEIEDEEEVIEMYNAYTLDDMLACYLIRVIDSRTFLSLVKAVEAYTDMEKKHWHLRENIRLVEYTRESIMR